MVSIRRTTIQRPFTLKGGYQHCPSNAPQTPDSRYIFDRATFGHAQYSLHSSTQHFYLSLLLSNCRLRIAQPFTVFRVSAQPLTLFFNCAPQHSHSFAQPFLSSFCFFLLRSAVSLIFYLLQIPTDVDSIATDP